MKFSVIIPVYNVIDYLKPCIESVLGQNYGDFELILVDDGSNDGSENLCDEYAACNANVKVIHKANGGQSSARNTGVDNANGEYFIFIDSDDYIAPETLGLFEDKIRKNGQLDVILSECMYNVEPDGTVIDVQRHLVSSEYEGITGRQAILRMGMEWSPCGKCYRTAYWKNKGFRFIEGIISEDFQLIDRVTLEADKVAMVPAHYYYRWKIQSSTMHVNYGKLVKDTIYVLEDWNEYLNNSSLNDDLETVIRTALANMLEHTVMGNINYAPGIMQNELIAGAGRCTYYLKYDRSLEGRLISIAIRTIGVGNTCYLLNKVKAIRKRKNRFI